MSQKASPDNLENLPDPRLDEEACFKYSFKLQSAGKLDLAKQAYRKLLEFNPGHVLALYNLGVAFESEGEEKQAFNHYQAASRLDPKYVRAQNNIGALLSRQERYKEAVAVFRQATETDPEFAESWANFCHALKQIGEKEEAVSAGLKAVKLAPDLFRAHNNLGVALLDSAKPKRAEKCFRKALKIEPNSRLALNNIATALEKQYRYEEAEPYFEKVTRLHPDYVRAQLNYAWSKLSLGKWDESIALSTNAMRLLSEEDTSIVADPEQSKRRVLNDSISREAMVAFVEIGEQHGVEFFLTFGTLLGCLRDDSLISYDTDIDLGYWDGVDILPMLKDLPKTLFTVRNKPVPGGKSDLRSVLQDTVNISIVYKNRVYLDLYRHWRKDGKILSGFELGATPLLYAVSEFKLQKTRFLDYEFLIPTMGERYLEECYGNWREPDPYFETSLDSPNLVAGFPPHAQALAYYRTAQRFFDGNHFKGMRLLDKLSNRLAEPDQLLPIRDAFQSRILEQSQSL